MTFLASFILMVHMLGQTAVAPADNDTVFSPEEKTKIQNTTSANDRIKIYQKASVRIQKDLQQSVAKEEFEAVPGTLKRWVSLLSLSYDDLEANLKITKKSRNLISYEIHVREAIADMRSYKLKAPVSQQDAFDNCIAQAEDIRRKIAEILFNL